jgi:hypothetical protein
VLRFRLRTPKALKDGVDIDHWLRGTRGLWIQPFASVFKVANSFGVFAGVLVVQGVIGYSLNLSSICTQQFGGNDEYNDHTHCIMHKGRLVRRLLVSPLSWLAIVISPLGFWLAYFWFPPRGV